MDFIAKATEKLDVKDKLPGQIKDKFPGEGNKRGEGGHLAQSREDGGGFPQGLRPASWMGDLIQKNLAPATAAVTAFHYPGSHDAATYGSGLESFSYQCQDKNFYEQMMTGQRFFDLRVAPDEENPKKFIPVHGIAKNTADDFNSGPRQAGKDDLATQIMRFAKEHPSEILILSIRVTDLQKAKDEFGEACWNLLGERLLEAPGEDGRVPTYEEAVRTNRNIILGLPINFKDHSLEKYVWHVGKNTPCWHGDGDQLLWNEPTWQSGEIKKVLNSTEEFMHKNESRTSRRDKLWVAQCQLTPVLGQGFSTFIKDGGSIRPKDLALGGGIGTHGGFEGSNQQLRESGVFKSALWKKNANCIIYDFCDTKTTGAIVAMNIGGDFSDDGPARAGAGEDEHEGAGRGGRGGRGGGRGGRGLHQEGPGRREEEEVGEGEGEGMGGRGAHRGGRGRGEHRGGRGREFE